MTFAIQVRGVEGGETLGTGRFPDLGWVDAPSATTSFDAVVDTNVLIDMFSCHDLFEAMATHTQRRH
jgi:hypothetical protein